jgi:hypothetical protein
VLGRSGVLDRPGGIDDEIVDEFSRGALPSPRRGMVQQPSYILATGYGEPPSQRTYEELQQEVARIEAELVFAQQRELLEQQQQQQIILQQLQQQQLAGVGYRPPIIPLPSFGVPTQQWQSLGSTPMSLADFNSAPYFPPQAPLQQHSNSTAHSIHARQPAHEAKDDIEYL